jgi:glycosyltransferase involved in cell wall biosynthesis
MQGETLKALLVSGYGFRYDIRFKYVRSIFEERGFLVKMVFSDFDHLKKERVSYEDAQVIGIKVPTYRKNISIRRLYSHIIFSYKLRKVLKLEKPDIIVADIPPNTIAGSVAWYKEKNPKCKVIFDVLDLWPESFSDSKALKMPFSFWKRIRTEALPKGDFVTLECDYYKEFLKENLKESQYSTLYLCKPALKERLKFSHEDGILGFCYIGSMNTIIDIPAMIKMLTDINRKRQIRLYLIGDGEKRELLLSQLRENEIDFEYLGLVFDETIKNDVLRKCHFGINIYNDNVIIGLTMKSLDYFRVGLPTISMNIYDTGKLVQEYQSGFELSKENWEKIMEELAKIKGDEWEKLHENTLKMFRENFSEAVFKKNFNEVIERCGINK